MTGWGITTEEKYLNNSLSYSYATIGWGSTKSTQKYRYKSHNFYSDRQTRCFCSPRAVSSEQMRKLTKRVGLDYDENIWLHHGRKWTWDWEHDRFLSRPISLRAHYNRPRLNRGTRSDSSPVSCLASSARPVQWACGRFVGGLKQEARVVVADHQPLTPPSLVLFVLYLSSREIRGPHGRVVLSKYLF